RHIEIDTGCGDLSLYWVELIYPTTRQLHDRASCKGANEGPFVSGFKAPLDNDDVFPEDHVLHNVAVTGKNSDEWADKLVSESRLSIYDTARKLQRHVFGVVGENQVLIGS